MSTGSSTGITIENGTMTRTVSYTFALTPLQAGEYTIPALQFVINGLTLTSPPQTLNAVKPGASASPQSGQQLAFFKLIVPKKEVYVGEVVSVEFRAYIRDGVANAGNILAEFDHFGGSPLKAEGFSVLKTAHMQERQARSGNVVYYVATLVSSLTPLKTGPLTINSIEVPLTLQIPAGRRRDMFDPFGMFQAYDSKNVTLTADSETLTALPLPTANVPTNFNGAVGSYSLNVTAGPTNVAVGDPVTVRIQISGHGPLDTLTLPDQPAWTDFRIYPPTAKVETSDSLGLQGSKSFEQVIVPQTIEAKSVPPFSFSYFDPDAKGYRTLTQPAVPLNVRPSASAPAPPAAAAARASQDNTSNTQDIVDIKQHFGSLAQFGSPLIERPWFLALQGLPVLLGLTSLVWRRRADNLANNPRLRRQRRLAQLLRDGLIQLRQLADENRSEEFFATLFRLLQEQLGERLDLPASAITEAVVEEHLLPRGVSETSLAPLRELFQTCNLARYAPTKSSSELVAIIPRFEAVLRELQGLKL